MVKNLLRKLFGIPYVYSEAKCPNNTTYFIKDGNVDYSLSITQDDDVTYTVLYERYEKIGKKYAPLNGRVGTITRSGIEELIEPCEEEINPALIEYLHEKLKEFKELINK